MLAINLPGVQEIENDDNLMEGLYLLQTIEDRINQNIQMRNARNVTYYEGQRRMLLSFIRQYASYTNNFERLRDILENVIPETYDENPRVTSMQKGGGFHHHQNKYKGKGIAASVLGTHRYIAFNGIDFVFDLPIRDDEVRQFYTEFRFYFYYIEDLYEGGSISQQMHFNFMDTLHGVIRILIDNHINKLIQLRHDGTISDADANLIFQGFFHNSEAPTAENSIHDLEPPNEQEPPDETHGNGFHHMHHIIIHK
jgi:hypothetical protein